MIIKLQNGDKLKIESDEKREARRKYKEHSLLSIGLKLKRNLNIASNFLKEGPNAINFGNAISALFGGYSPENPDLHYGEAPGVGIKNFANLVRTARVAREFNDVVKGPVNLFKLLNNFIEKFVTNPKGSGKLVHYDKGNGKSIYQENRGASIINSKLIPGKTKREGLKDYTWWNTDNPYMNVHKAKEGPFSPTRYIVVDDNTQFKHPFDLKEPVGQSAGKGRGFIIKTERVTDKPVDLTNAEIYEKSPFGWWEKIKVLPTPEVTKSKQSKLISSDTYPLYRGPRFDINEIVNSDGTVNPRKAMLVLHTVAKQFGKGAYKMEHRLENPEWHKGDPNTYEHTKRVAQSAWEIPTPEGYTKLDLMIAALGHDFGKIIAGDGHAQIGAELAKQVFPNLTNAQYIAIAEHMGSPTTLLGKATKMADMRNGIVVRNINGKTRILLPTHTDAKPREIVMEPKGNNKYYIHMRVWDDVKKHIPGNINNVEKSNLFQTLYETLPDGAEILFPKSGPGNYGTRGTVAGLQRLSKDPRFTPGTKGILQYLDKDGKTVKTYEGTSFIKTPKVGEKPAVNKPLDNKYKREDVLIGDEWGADLYSYPEYVQHRINKIKKASPNIIGNYNPEEFDHLYILDNNFTPMARMNIGANMKGLLSEIIRRLNSLYRDVPLEVNTTIKQLGDIPFVIGYFNNPGYTGMHNPKRNLSLVDPVPKTNLLSSIMHEHIMHGTDKWMTKSIAEKYLKFVDPIINGTNGTYKWNGWTYKVPEDTGAWQEGRATLGEIRKSIYDKLAKSKGIKISPETIELLRPEFEKIIDDLTIELASKLLTDTGGYGEVYGRLGPKNNPKFLQQFKYLMKVAPTTIPFLIPRKEEKK